MGSETTYFPDQGDDNWARIDAADAGFASDRLADALAFAEAHESPWPRDLEAAGSVPGLTQIEPEPWNAFLGPLKPRGGASGLLLKGGKIVADWGTPDRVDMTFSIAKSYLAVLAGVAVADGLIADIDTPVSKTIAIPQFSGPHNGAITWRHLLTQTSEWTGTLFDKPDQVDHFRQVGAGSDNSRKGQERTLSAPGDFWEYNDVRVNVLSLALMHVFRRPLPEVLQDRIMDPIGASDTWEWHGYRNSILHIDGRDMASVPGGTHWGGGLWINSYDHARFGLLIARGGVWNGKQLLPATWVDEMFTPIDLYRAYGLLWWLNTEKSHYPDAPETSVFALGAGSNLIWIDRALDIVAVLRWVDQASTNAVLGRFTTAMD